MEQLSTQRSSPTEYEERKKLSAQSLAQLGALELSDPGESASPLHRRLYELLNRPLASLSVVDWRVLIAQDHGLDFLVAPAMDALEKAPLLETEHFQGDLLVALLGADPTFYASHPDLRLRLERLLERVPAALDELDFINFDTTSEALEEAISEFRAKRRP